MEADPYNGPEAPRLYWLKHSNLISIKRVHLLRNLESQYLIPKLLAPRGHIIAEISITMIRNLIHLNSFFQLIEL